MRCLYSREKVLLSETKGPVSTVDVAFRWRLEPSDGSQILTLDVSTSIFAVAMQCDVDLELLDTESNVAILSRTNTEPNSDSKLLATYRCQENTSHIDIKFRAKEGKSGELNILLLPHEPNVCQTYVHKVKPLCLHQKLPKEPENLPELPLCEVVISGNFTLEEIHSWLSACIPQIPPRMAEDSSAIWYENVFSKTYLFCQFRSAEAKFQSDSISVMAILRDALTHEATRHHQRISLNFSPHPKCLEHNLQQLWPKIEYLKSVGHKASIALALNELKLQVSSVLSPKLP